MQRLLILIACFIGYWFLQYVPGFSLVFFTIEMFCTFLHEFGHALFAILTGGRVHSLCVNLDGSGVTTIAGGNNAILTMGGYVGSALFGNIIIRCSTPIRARILSIVLTIALIFSSLLWFNNIVTTAILMSFSVVFFILSKTNFSSYVMSFLGAASIIYIIQDFNVGPTSDLKSYEQAVGLFSANAWMYIWLMIVISLTLFNMYHILKSSNDQEARVY